jgi:predicted transcriptional regulator
MTQENKDRLLGLLQQHKELGIVEQIDFDKSMTDSLIANSVALVDSDDGTAIDDSERKWSIKPSLAEKMVDILQFVADKEEITMEIIVTHFGFTATTAKRYLRQLTEFGYLEAHGGNKNRTYSKKGKL